VRLGLEPCFMDLGQSKYISKSKNFHNTCIPARSAFFFSFFILDHAWGAMLIIMHVNHIFYYYFKFFFIYFIFLFFLFFYFYELYIFFWCIYRFDLLVVGIVFPPPDTWGCRVFVDPTLQVVFRWFLFAPPPRGCHGIFRFPPDWG